jgi:hypothetical protein
VILKENLVLIIFFFFFLTLLKTLEQHNSHVLSCVSLDCVDKFKEFNFFFFFFDNSIVWGVVK